MTEATSLIRGADIDIVLVDGSGDYGPTENFWILTHDASLGEARNG